MRFKRKVIEVDAEQFIPENEPWPVGVYEDKREETPPHKRYCLCINPSANRWDLEAYCHIRPTDWVVTYDGSTMRFSDAAFREEYDPA